MQAAADAVQSGMVSVIGLDSAKVAALCEAATERVGVDKPVQIANFLCPGNYAVSGSEEVRLLWHAAQRICQTHPRLCVQGCAKVIEIAKPEFKARMTVKLAVAGAFHTTYMAPAVGKLKEALAATNIVTPRLPVISNVDAQPHSDPETIKDILSRQARARLGVSASQLARNRLLSLAPDAGDEPGAVGEHGADAAGKGSAVVVRDWAKQGHFGHPQAHRQDAQDQER